jgi:hypothetical protein
MPDEPTRPAATMFDKAQADLDEAYGAGGRFAKQERPRLTGTTPQWQAPAIGGTSPWAVPDGAGTEPPLGFSIEDLPDMRTTSGYPPEEPAAPEDEQPTEEPEQ